MSGTKTVEVPVPLTKGASLRWWVSSLLALVPEEFAEVAEISFAAEDSYGNWEAVATVSYMRPMLPEEEADYAKHQAASESKVRSKELRELERLQAKYGVPPPPAPHTAEELERDNPHNQWMNEP
jgi:hypothetical protein